MLIDCGTAVTAADFWFSDTPPAEVKAPLNIKHYTSQTQKVLLNKDSTGAKPKQALISEDS